MMVVWWWSSWMNFLSVCKESLRALDKKQYIISTPYEYYSIEMDRRVT